MIAAIFISAHISHPLSLSLLYMFMLCVTDTQEEERCHLIVIGSTLLF